MPGAAGRDRPRTAWRGATLGVVAALPVVAAEYLLIALRLTDLAPSAWDRALLLAVVLTFTSWPAALFGSVGFVLSEEMGVGDLVTRVWGRARWAALAVTVALAAAGMLLVWRLPAVLDLEGTRTFALVAAWVGLVVALFRLDHRRRARPLKFVDVGASGWFQSRAATVWIAVVLWSTLFVAFRWSEAPNTRTASLHYAPVTGLVARVLTGSVDLDGDGFSSLFGGQDCDDLDPSRRPGALEIAGNGIDEDCDGSDLGFATVVVAAIRVAHRAMRLSTAESKRAGRSEVAPVFPRLSVVHITVDTVRADAVGPHRGAASATPNLDRLGAGGAVFTHAYSQGAKTKVSVPSVMTGRFFSELHRSGDRYTQIYADNTLLPEALSALGYHTAAIASHAYLCREHGYAQGFDRFSNLVDGESLWYADGVVDRGIAALRGYASSEDPFYLWLHIIDPHHPYVPHASLWDTRDGEHPFRWDASRQGRYRAEIYWTDRQLARLFAAIDELGLAGRVLVIVHSDHGEAFGEHGHSHHGQALYDEQTRVPLILAGPGVVPGRYDTPVMLLDLFGTVLAMARNEPLDEQRVEAPERGHGINLLPSLAGLAKLPDRPVFSEIPAEEGDSQLAVISGGWKLIHSSTYGTWQLYDLSADPDEAHNLFAKRPTEAHRLRRVLVRFQAEGLSRRPPAH